MTDRIIKALDIAIQYGGYDGAHHKDWCIDQIVRALTGCPTETHSRVIKPTGKLYTWEAQGTSEEYLQLIRDACDGVDGPHTYSWDTGIPP